MNLTDYIKSIDAFLLNEDVAPEPTEDIQNKVEELKTLKNEFLTFLEAIEEKGIELKTIQAKLKGGEESSKISADTIVNSGKSKEPADNNTKELQQGVGSRTDSAVEQVENSNKQVEGSKVEEERPAKPELSPTAEETK